MASEFWRAVAEKSASALASGALQPVSTTSTIIEDGGVRFLTRISQALERKRLDGIEKPSDFDPFGQPEEALFIENISKTHYCVLNKFNVVEHHVLVVTREFEDQDAPLTRADFDAVWRCLEGSDGLVFYNSGPLAGASQRHKHLQIVPVPLGEGPERAPIEVILDTGLPFAHATARLDDLERAHERYLSLLSSVGNPGAYNLLATRDWMLVVPRTRDAFRAISVNALGFAGALLVRSEEQLSELKQLGPMRVLRQVTENV